MGLSISRGELVACAERAIVVAERSGAVGEFRKRRLLKVAREMELVLVDGWVAGGVRGPCGCLVGTLFPDVEDRLMDASFDAYYRVGVEFNVQLRRALASKLDLDLIAARVVQVLPAATGAVAA